MELSRKSKIVKIDKQGVSKFLGELEAEVMEVMWRLNEATVKKVNRLMEANGRSFAYTTILTVMQNLEKKGLLRVRKENKKNIYSPAMTKEEFLKRMVGETVRSLIEDFPEEVVSHLVEANELQEEEIERLLKLLRERRKN